MKEISGKPGQIQNISPKTPPSQKGKTPAGQASSFEKTLSKQINDTNTKSDQTSISQGLPELESSYQAAFISMADKSTEITEKISSSIDLLEEYASWLLDPEKTLKQAYGLLKDLDQQTRELNQELELSPKADQKLKQIITQLTTTAQVEQIKINRGDYLDLA
jgi:uncharacterized membrane protein YhiD involved in acid resistance